MRACYWPKNTRMSYLKREYIVVTLCERVLRADRLRGKHKISYCLGEPVMNSEVQIHIKIEAFWRGNPGKEKKNHTNYACQFED